MNLSGSATSAKRYHQRKRLVLTLAAIIFSGSATLWAIVSFVPKPPLKIGNAELVAGAGPMSVFRRQ
jgi:hypothetical protein